MEPLNYILLIAPKATQKTDNTKTEKEEMTEKEKTILENLYRCRDLELNNLWQKSIFLAPFLILCFTGYGFLLVELVKSGMPTQRINMLCIALCVISTIFSILWIYMFKGSKAQYELCERAIANYEKKLGFPINYRMGSLKYDEIEFNNCFLSTKAGKFSPSKINIVIGQTSLWLWIFCFTFHIVKTTSIIEKIYPEVFSFIEEPYKIILIILTSIIFLLILIALFAFCIRKKVRSSYLTLGNEEEYIKILRLLTEKKSSAVENNESNNKCNEEIIRLKENKSAFLPQELSVLESLQEVYNISSKRAKELEKLSEIEIYPLTTKEEKYLEKCRNFIEKGGNIETQGYLLNYLATALGIDNKRAEKIKNYVKDNKS